MLGIMLYPIFQSITYPSSQNVALCDMPFPFTGIRWVEPQLSCQVLKEGPPILLVQPIGLIFELSFEFWESILNSHLQR